MSRREKKPSPKWATIREVAEHFCVGETTVREGRGVFAQLRRVTVTPGRTLVPRADVEKLDRMMERAAVALDDDPGGLKLAS